jgi:hypothetical protein
MNRSAIHTSLNLFPYTHKPSHPDLPSKIQYLTRLTLLLTTLSSPYPPLTSLISTSLTLLLDTLLALCVLRLGSSIYPIALGCERLYHKSAPDRFTKP